jgi:hypothetical protein
MIEVKEELNSQAFLNMKALRKSIDNINSFKSEVDKIVDYLKSKRKIRSRTSDAYNTLVKRKGKNNGY